MKSQHDQLLNQEFKTYEAIYKESLDKQLKIKDRLVTAVVVLAIIVLYMTVAIVSLNTEVNDLNERCGFNNDHDIIIREIVR